MRSLLLLLLIAYVPMSSAHEHGGSSSAGGACGEMEVWDYAESMCQPLAMPGMPQQQIMIHGNAFAVESAGAKPRGRADFSVPNFLMVDAGRSFGERHFVGVSLMATDERWTYPTNGYPQLLQQGEAQNDGTPFIDAQHPHSSPVMGLTLSDTYTLGAGHDHVKVWFSPRGESGDGPVSFMHRATGQVNPDAPLGHHIGQDAGHISSTVVGAGLHLSDSTLEASAFHGAEPEPDQVDLPLGRLDSFSGRFIQRFSPRAYAMASFAFVKDPEPQDKQLDHFWRYSGSYYWDGEVCSGVRAFNTLIWGLINGYDGASALNSFAEEFLLKREAHSVWGRVEVLQRTPAQLAVASPDPNGALWVNAFTLGYTHQVAMLWGMDLGVGGSFTQYALPAALGSAYGRAPVEGKVFLQMSGMGLLGSGNRSGND